VELPISRLQFEMSIKYSREILSANAHQQPP
jgi:hypothetical protein